MQITSYSEDEEEFEETDDSVDGDGCGLKMKITQPRKAYDYKRHESMEMARNDGSSGINRSMVKVNNQ